MGYFDGVINSYFKESAEGKPIFYPYGIFGHGYIISEESEAKLKSFLKPFIILSILSGALIGRSLPWYLLIIICLNVGVFYHFKIKQLMPGATRTTEKKTFSEITKDLAKSMGMVKSVMFLVGSVVMMLASLFVFFLADLSMKFIAAVGAILFGLGCFQGVLLIRYCVRNKSQKSEECM